MQYLICAINKPDHYSVQVVLISVVNLAQAYCQFQGLMNLEVPSGTLLNMK